MPIDRASGFITVFLLTGCLIVTGSDMKQPILIAVLCFAMISNGYRKYYFDSF